VRDTIRQLHPELKRKVREALTEILVDPGCGKPLKRDLEGYWSLRIGRHRLIYRPDEAGAEVVAFGPRRTIYDDLTRSATKRRSKAV
jgi:mRNA interferase RelE/StbE